MATSVLTFTPNTSGYNRNLYVGFGTVDNITITDSTFILTAPIVTYAYDRGSGSSSDGSTYIGLGFIGTRGTFHYGSNGPIATVANTSYGAELLYNESQIKTSDFFNTQNQTSRTNWISYTLDYLYGSVVPTDGQYTAYEAQSVSTNHITTLTLNAPPTFTISNTTVDTPTYKSYGTNIHSNITVDVNNPTAQYGGYITSIKLVVGSQNQELTYSSSNQPSATTSLSLTFEEKGTFTPTVTVTDSRGQQTTQTLDPVTVQEYQLPTAKIGNIYRINAQGKDDEEGTYIKARVTFDYDDNWVKLTTPTVRLLNSSGEAVSGWSLIKWYRSQTAQPPNQWIGVNWSTVTKNQTVGVCIQLPSNSSVGYTIEITPKATTGTETHTGSPTTAFVQPAFFTIDFLAGGKGIAFGGPVSQDGFWDYMSTYFMTDIFMNLDSTQASGTDYDLLNAISNLGWTSDVTSST